MQEKVEKYIYYISEDKYRVKFLKVNKVTNQKIKFDQYVYGTLEDAIKIRDDKLIENGLSINEEKKQEDIFEVKKERKKKQEPKQTKEKKKVESTTSNNVGKYTKVDKYIYEIEKGKKYRIFIRKGGTNGQKGDYYSAIFEGTLAQARKERDKKLAELKLKNGKSDKGSIKFIDFVRIYYKEYAEIELSPATVRGGKTALKNYILPEIANVPLDKIDTLTIQRIINNLKERNRQRLDKDGNVVKLSPITVNNVYRLLRKILNKAVAWDYIEKNPVLKVKAPPTKRAEKQSYNRDELIEILDILKQEDILTETLFTIAICSGLRRSELVGLHLEDIDWDRNMIKIRRSVVWDQENQKIVEKETKTAGSVREVPLPSFCMEIIKKYLNFRLRIIERFKKRNSNYVAPRNLFLSKYGGIMFPDTPSSKWLKFRKRHKELRNVSLHGLRHSYCTMQMNENPNLAPVDVQKLMGHSQLSTTFIYTHSNADKTEDAISVFDIYCKAGEIVEFNFNEMLSLYTQLKFVSSARMKELLQITVPLPGTDKYKYDLIKEYIDNHYPTFKEIDVSQIDMNNIWDWLEQQKEVYGNKFPFKPICTDEMLKTYT